MPRGLYFELPNNSGDLFEEIFKNIDIEKYWWQIHFSDVFRNVNNTSQNIFSDKSILNGKEMLRLMNNGDYYMCFLSALAAESNPDELSKLTSYNDFLCSDNVLLVEIYDVVYVKIYCKSDLLMDKLKINATNLKCNNIRIVDDDNDDEYFKDFS